MNKVILVTALLVGGLLTYVDTRPKFDDTGVLAAAILVSTMAFGFFGPKTPWLWALAVAVWIPAIAIVRTQNFGSLLALVIAFVGAYLGMAIRQIVAGPKTGFPPVRE
jgi:hypothetical protein